MNPPAPNPTEPLLELRDAAIAAIHTPGLVLVEDVNWTVNAGDYWVLAALPGAGKTDLLSTAAGLARPLRGEHRLFGRDVAHLHEEELIATRLKVGFVFGDGGRLFTNLTVAENLALPLCYHRDCPATDAEPRVRQVLDALELRAIAHNTPGRITRSQRHRVALARALVLEPELLLIDNPLAGADMREARWWLEFVDRLARGHDVLGGHRGTIAVATHDLAQWLNRGTRFALIQDRRFRVLGGREELLGDQEPLLQDLLGPTAGGRHG